MPYQSVPSLLVIAGAFNAAAGLMWGAQRLGFGEVCYFCFVEYVQFWTILVDYQNET